MEKIISFSIAAYNAQDTLKKCLDSFLVPDYLDDCLEKIEVIVVDDGSIDSTAKIALEYCEKYPDSEALQNFCIGTS